MTNDCLVLGEAQRMEDYGYGVSFGSDEKCSKINCGDVCTTLIILEVMNCTQHFQWVKHTAHELRMNRTGMGDRSQICGNWVWDTWVSVHFSFQYHSLKNL